MKRAYLSFTSTPTQTLNRCSFSHFYWFFTIFKITIIDFLVFFFVLFISHSTLPPFLNLFSVASQIVFFSRFAPTLSYSFCFVSSLFYTAIYSAFNRAAVTVCCLTGSFPFAFFSTRVDVIFPSFSFALFFSLTPSCFCFVLRCLHGFLFLFIVCLFSCLLLQFFPIAPTVFALLGVLSLFFLK